MTSIPVDDSVNAEQFSQRWSEFLAVLETVSRRKLRRNRNERFRQNLLPLLNRVFERLRSEESISSLKNAVEDELQDLSSVEALSFLQEELIFYVAWQGGSAEENFAWQGVAEQNAAWQGSPTGQSYDVEDHSLLEAADDDTDDAIGAGKTIKDSAEKLIKKLPWFLRNLLKILNELLSILRGGS